MPHSSTFWIVIFAGFINGIFFLRDLPPVFSIISRQRFARQSIGKRGAEKQKAAVPFVRDRRLLRRLYAIDRLSKRDREALVRTIDAFLAKVTTDERRSA